MNKNPLLYVWLKCTSCLGSNGTPESPEVEVSKVRNLQLSGSVTARHGNGGVSPLP
jgi:hypothetical protein